MVKPTVRRVGNSPGITLPAQAAQALRAKEGEQGYLSEAPGGGSRLPPRDPNFAETMTVAEDFMRRYKNALRELGRGPGPRKKK